MEYKNLSRQNFIERDLEKNKAEVLAERYSKAFKINIFSQNEYLTKVCSEINEFSNLFAEEEKELLNTKETIKRYNIIISCVDNVGTRFDIIKFFSKKSSNNKNTRTVVIDAGNSEYAGQVIYTEEGFSTFREIFPDTKEEKDRPNELSCADHALSAPQNIAANMTAAQLIFNYFNIAYNNLTYILDAIVNRELIPTIIKNLTPIDNNITYFNIKTNSYIGKLEGEETIEMCKQQKEIKNQLTSSSMFSSETQTIYGDVDNITETTTTETTDEFNNEELDHNTTTNALNIFDLDS